jgi:hypothetical protein
LFVHEFCNTNQSTRFTSNHAQSCQPSPRFYSILIRIGPSQRYRIASHRTTSHLHLHPHLKSALEQSSTIVTEALIG